jgi:hypothetical protein
MAQATAASAAGGVATTAAATPARGMATARIDAIGAALTPTRQRSPLGLFGSPMLRRGYAIGLAAALTIGTSAAVIAAPPGSPFYNARLVIEAALMPSVAHLDARLAAYEAQFDARLGEAERALKDRDADALAAALGAYQAEVEHALAEIGTDDARLTRLQAVLEVHIARLEALAARLPTEVARQSVVLHAIAASERAVARLQDRAAGDDAPPGQGGGNQNGGNNGGPDEGSTGNGGGGQNGGNGAQGGNGGAPQGTPNKPDPDDGDGAGGDDQDQSGGSPGDDDSQ